MIMMVHLSESVIRILRLRWTRIRDLKRRFGGLPSQVSGLDSGLLLPTLSRHQLHVLRLWSDTLDQSLVQPIWWQPQRAVGRQLGLETWMPREQQAPLVWLCYGSRP
jgi:hypothetical protein